jgi:hypothetical protein
MKDCLNSTQEINRSFMNKINTVPIAGAAAVDNQLIRDPHRET